MVMTNEKGYKESQADKRVRESHGLASHAVFINNPSVTVTNNIFLSHAGGSFLEGTLDAELGFL